MPPFSRNLAEEGVLIRNFKLVDGGRFREEELRQLLLAGPYPTRSVRDNLADVSAQAAANHSGVQQLLALVERYSLPVVEAYMGHIQAAAERKMRQSLDRIPDGIYQCLDHLDQGSPIAVTITITGSNATVDFTGTGPVITAPPSGGSAGGLNLHANRAIVTAAVLYVFRCLINEDIPLNSGVLNPVRLILPKCLLNPPEHDDPTQCAAIVGGNVETSQRVVDVLLGALHLAAASQGPDVRRRHLRLLRDDLRRLGRDHGSGWGRCGAHPYDQHPPDRSRSDRTAVSGAAARVFDSAWVGGPPDRTGWSSRRRWRDTTD
jgi:5-oxoprolinase (ATP-hydrolysing)